MTNCDPIQKSLDWCEGKPQFAGIRRRVFYTAKSNVLSVPKVETDSKGHPKSGVLVGDFVMREGKVFYGIDHLADKAQVTSEPQGDYPSQSSHDKAVLIYPGIGAEASAAAAYFHNTDNIYIIEDYDGHARVIGIENMWPAKGSVAMDFGQGATGTTATTITIEGDNRVPFPEYRGKIITEDGEIDYSIHNPDIEAEEPGEVEDPSEDIDNIILWSEDSAPTVEQYPNGGFFMLTRDVKSIDAEAKAVTLWKMTVVDGVPQWKIVKE